MKKILPPHFSQLIPGSALLALLFILIGPSSSKTPALAEMQSQVIVEIPAKNSPFVIGEELQYNVSYSIFDIGMVKMQIVDTARKNGVKVFRAKTYLDSYSGLPFVDLHQVFYSEMDSDAYSYMFVAHNTVKPEKKPFIRYAFDYKKNRMTYELGTDPGNIITKSGEETVAEKQLDGLSLFYYARNNFRQVKKFSVPVFVSEKSYKTHFNFINKVGEQEIDAISYPVEVVEFSGSSEFTGVFGLTGDFRGFFSNDDAGIPIVAKMKVILGSVHIELIKWTRPGWVPPKAK